MVCDDGVAFTIKSTVAAVHKNVMGDMVECGTWRGGCGLAMLLAQRKAFGHVERKVHFFDSFEGLPPADKRDGARALEWQAETAHNCRASRADLHRTLTEKFGFRPTEFAIWHGWFADTIPRFLASTAQGIAVLRLDGDWYSSTETALRYLVPRVDERGTVIIDDYYAWDGCARAVHDYLSRNDLPYKIMSLLKNSGAYFIKQENET
jgi:O-methyltransferase